MKKASPKAEHDMTPDATPHVKPNKGKGRSCHPTDRSLKQISVTPRELDPVQIYFVGHG